MLGLLASIPSPSSGAIHLGPFQLRAYGLMIALGVVAAVWLTGKRFEEQHVGTREDAGAIALWAVPAGIVGARLYHVITDWELFRDDPIRVVKIWEGGLGIWGGIAAGVGVGLLVARKRGLPLGPTLTCVAPALPLAQAIGRWGNWWNQELFGGPTTLPWAVRIDVSNRPPGYEGYTTFHPTFLYESLWNLALVGFLLWLEKRVRLRPGRLFVVYVAGYTLGRFWWEWLRIDPANQVAGLRVNEWVALIVFAGALGFLAADHWRPPLAAVEAPTDSVAGAGREPGLGADGADGVAAEAEAIELEREVIEAEVEEAEGADAGMAGDEPREQGEERADAALEEVDGVADAGDDTTAAPRRGAAPT